MARGQMRSVVRYLRDLAGPPAPEISDRRLLERFAAVRDEGAFETLVRRHGPLVWGVCQRVLGHCHDAEDVFQATFFVLARKAAAVRWRDSVGSWLHEVAYRLSQETRVKAARRRFHEMEAAVMASAIAPPASRDREVFALLDEELHRLPTKYRAPLLECYLRGRTSDQAAKQLGWSLRTLQRRLAQGRELLRARLARRGVTLSSVLLLGILSQGTARAALPSSLVAATTEAAVPFAFGGTIGEAPGTALAHGFLKGGWTMTRWKFAGALAILLATTASSGLVARQFGATAAAEPSETATLEQETGSAKDKPAKSEVDKFAGQMWDVLEVLSKQHLDPCPRADLIVAGVGAVRKTARSEDPGKAQTDEASGLPQEFQRRASAVNSREEFAVLLAALWPRETKVSREKLEQSFLEGVARRVGGELRVLPGPEMKIQEQISANRYVGIGIQIKKNEAEQRAQVVNAIRGGAARAAGMKADDIILKVDGKDTKDVSISGVVDWIRNEEGTKVTVEVKQPGASEARTYTMTRAVVPFESLTGFRRAPADEWDYRPNPGTPVAYLHVGSLRTSTLQELRQLEPKLRGQGFRALVLDLRNSSGDGLVRNSALLADGLLDGGLMWSTRGVDEKSRHEYRADRECMFRDWPLAVLVDETLDRQHALVAAALQDNGRAVVVGEPTKTDGYVNQVVTLPDGKTGLIFRSGILERAAKEKGWPVKPDHVVAFGPKAREALVEWRHKQEIAEGPTNDKAPDDPQLARAVEVVRDALRKAPATAKP